MMEPPGNENLSARICCHAIRVEGEDMTDYSRAEEHFSKLAEGGHYPGLYAVIKQTEKANFVEQLVELINKSRTNLQTAVSNPQAVAAAASGGGAPPAALADTPGLGLLLEMVAAANAGEGDVPTFASGFTAATDVDGKEQVEPWLLVRFGQLSIFRATLGVAIGAVRQAGEPGSREVEKIVQNLQISATMLSIAEPMKADVPLEKIFSYILGFPVKSDIFKVTPQILANMTQEDFDQWTKGVEACDSIMRGYIENPKLWKALGRNNNPDDRQGYLRISELP
jgi:hypothetical protein